MIGIIGAMEIETSGIKKLMSDTRNTTIAQIDFTSGKLNGKDVVCATCNPGKVNAALCAQIMISSFSPDIILNSGVAGSLSGELDVLDVAIATACVQHDFDTSPLGAPKGMIEGLEKIRFECDSDVIECLEKICENDNFKSGIIATGDVFVSGETQKNEIRSAFDAIACEMEGGAIAQVCYVNNVKFGALRVISDGASEMDFNTFKFKAAEKSIDIMNEFIKSF